jgi:hypothetical protein
MAADEQHAADEQRVDEDGEAEPEAELLEQVMAARQEGAEDQDHDPRGGGDDAGAVGLPGGDGAVVTQIARR